MDNTASDPAVEVEPMDQVVPPRESGSPPSKWKENHGNFLLGFLAVIMVLGGSILAYRQSRFVPPSFPDGQFIEEISSDDEEPVGSVAILIEVTGAATDSGQIAMAIFDGSSRFNDPAEAELTHNGAIIDGVSIWTVPYESLPERFAVAAFHDENNDGQLNRNRFGIPTERYGFSRNARGLTGPPTFQQAVIDRPEVGTTVPITIR